MQQAAGVVEEGCNGDRVRFTVAIDWVRGRDPDIVVRSAGSNQSDRDAIAYALRLAAELVEAADAEIQMLS